MSIFFFSVPQSVGRTTDLSPLNRPETVLETQIEIVSTTEEESVKTPKPTLKKSTFARIALVTALAACTAAVPLGAASASQEADSAGTIAAIKDANPGVIERSALKSSRSIGSAIRGLYGATSVDVPSDPVDGIDIGLAHGKNVNVGLPFAASADDADQLAAGVVSYDNRNDSKTVPVVVDDGSVVIHTIIDSSNAPTTYTYDFALEPGSTFELHPSGDVVALSAEGNFEFAIAAPWAKDADGRPVPTHYELTGNRLSQVVEHSESSAFPIVADPTIGGFYMDRYSWNAAGDRITIWPTFAGGTFNPGLVGTYGWIELIEKTPKANTASVNQQFVCHASGNAVLWAAGATWDLETYRGTVSNPVAMFGSLCNW